MTYPQHPTHVPLVDAPPGYDEVWDPSSPPNGAHVCGECGTPVKAEPCPAHGPAAAEDFHAETPGCCPQVVDAVVDLGRLALAFGRIDRTAVYHPDGVTPESDTDHTVMLGWLACALAARWFPRLDLGLVAQFALVHDAPEVYAGDTPTLRIDAAGRAAKTARERAAIKRLATDFRDSLPWFPDAIAAYERQELPEARFVRGLDKVLPKIVHLLDGCAGLREVGLRRAELIEVFEQQRTEMAGYAGEFRELMHLRAELVHRVIDRPEIADRCA